MYLSFKLFVKKLIIIYLLLIFLLLFYYYYYYYIFILLLLIIIIIISFFLAHFSECTNSTSMNIAVGNLVKYTSIYIFSRCAIRKCIESRYLQTFVLICFGKYIIIL
jgi:hypothetical protein